MSGYFQRLAQRTGLVVLPSSRAGARRRAASFGNSPGLEQERIVEVSGPGPVPAAREHSRSAVTAPGHETDRAMPPPADRLQTVQTRAPSRDLHFTSRTVAPASPAARDGTIPRGHAGPALSVEAREALPAKVSAMAVAPRGSDTEPTAPTVAQPAPGPLEHDQRRPVAPAAVDARPEPVRDSPARPRAEDSAPLRAQTESGSIGMETRPSSRPRFVTEVFGQPVAERPSVIDVRIASVAVEIHQAAPQLPTSAPVPRERFSLSRHYIRMD